jgi:hypothetical protein
MTQQNTVDEVEISKATIEADVTISIPLALPPRETGLEFCADDRCKIMLRLLKSRLWQPENNAC